MVQILFVVPFSRYLKLAANSKLFDNGVYNPVVLEEGSRQEECQRCTTGPKFNLLVYRERTNSRSTDTCVRASIRESYVTTGNCNKVRKGNDTGDYNQVGQALFLILIET